jgi:hypothetical protein
MEHTYRVVYILCGVIGIVFVLATTSVNAAADVEGLKISVVLAK